MTGDQELLFYSESVCPKSPSEFLDHHGNVPKVKIHSIVSNENEVNDLVNEMPIPEDDTNSCEFKGCDFVRKSTTGYEYHLMAKHFNEKFEKEHGQIFKNPTKFDCPEAECKYSPTVSLPSTPVKYRLQKNNLRFHYWRSHVLDKYMSEETNKKSNANKSRKFKFTKEQILILNNFYAQNNDAPNSKEREILANQIGVKKEQIRNWFNNNFNKLEASNEVEDQGSLFSSDSETESSKTFMDDKENVPKLQIYQNLKCDYCKAEFPSSNALENHKDCCNSKEEIVDDKKTDTAIVDHQFYGLEKIVDAEEFSKSQNDQINEDEVKKDMNTDDENFSNLQNDQMNDDEWEILTNAKRKQLMHNGSSQVDPDIGTFNTTEEIEKDFSKSQNDQTKMQDEDMDDFDEYVDSLSKENEVPNDGSNENKMINQAKITDNSMNNLCEMGCSNYDRIINKQNYPQHLMTKHFNKKFSEEFGKIWKKLEKNECPECDYLPKNDNWNRHRLKNYLKSHYWRNHALVKYMALERNKNVKNDHNKIKSKPSAEKTNYKFTQDQISILKDFYDKNPNPDRHDREIVANQIGAKKKKINQWFQNTRQKLGVSDDQSRSTCILCGKQFNSANHKFILKRHIGDVHDKIKLGTKNHVKINHQNEKQLHGDKFSHLINSKNGHVKCTKCNKIFKNKYSAQAHTVRKHMPKEFFKCTNCEYSANKFNLRTHLNVVHNLKGKNLIEKYCLKLANVKKNVPKEDFNLKNTKPPLQSESSEHKPQTDDANSERHMKSVQENYTCDFCDKKYSEYNILEKHIGKEHAKTSNNVNGFLEEKKCKHCGKDYGKAKAWKSMLNKHLITCSSKNVEDEQVIESNISSIDNSNMNCLSDPQNIDTVRNVTQENSDVENFQEIESDTIPSTDQSNRSNRKSAVCLLLVKFPFLQSFHFE